LITSYFHNGLYSNSIIKEFLSVFCRNFIVALPLQIIIMGPIVRFLFNKFIKTSPNNLVLKN